MRIELGLHGWKGFIWFDFWVCVELAGLQKI